MNADVYKYDDLPEPLKVKIFYIWREVISHIPEAFLSRNDIFYPSVEQALCEEFGSLTNRPRTAEEDVYEFFLQQQDIRKSLRIIEIVFNCFVPFTRGGVVVNYHDTGLWRHINLAVEKMNARFQEHAIGYEFREGKIIRIDSGFMHKETVTPAMVLLREPYLSGANQEFLKAHEHFRHHRFGECINECLKAFESTMKAICEKRSWNYNQNDTAKTLLATCEKHGLFPTFMQSSLSELRSVLENVPTVRNKLSGHGQGAQPVHITDEVGAFVLHSTGANILILTSLEKKLK